MIRRWQTKAGQAEASQGERAASAPGPGRSLDRRVVASRQRVLAAALDLMTETGLGGLTIDDVSRRSGVAKTTIYRHWPNRTALIIDACLQMNDGDEIRRTPARSRATRRPS